MTGSIELSFGAGMHYGEAETVNSARRMEALGFDYFSVGEHYMQGRPPLPTSASIPLLGVAAGATERIRLLSSVVLVPFMHPVVLAKLATTLDNASRGRFTLGIGIGGEFPMEFEAAGLNVRRRGSMTNESLEVIRRLWTGESVTHEGRYYSMKDVTLAPQPTQKPNPPIWVAGRRDAAMMRAAKYGDGWYPYFYSPERYKDSYEKINRFAAEIGRDLTNFEWAVMPYISIYPTVEEATQVGVRAASGQYEGDFARVVRQYWALGPVDNCVNRLMEYVDAGAQHILFAISCPDEDYARHLEAISKEVIPELRKRVAAA
ncbi:MAG TPA: LLM class flavin-dependent oxidoreductase [SAR202 cluster bacterium]|nr:LLM class flavin-dependent oxidoreductase [SAR202 cluster bacterium]MDP7226867.1 LLM class flavin-dependent oxidoreductase [SAR202 cluster bacterium]MDP7413084.1 LLM class flavin-dependent oxidoreductase [SAR202 cluster bacterium]HJO81287.1 LLM class flavin-dependent oxidoreductase [SAR202 cluster bacterium]